ncbi:MAG: hypothetical protein U0325_05945 [Polyangiales bacterium]
MLPPRAFAPLLALLAAGCFNKIELAVAVIAPDGGNPFHGPDAATQARATVENGLGGPLTVPVAANGGFTLGLELNAIQRPSRLRIEALRAGQVIGSGATPPVFWDRLAASVVPVYMQRSDTVVPAPAAVSLETPRTAPAVVPINSPFVAVFGGNDTEAAVDVLDLFNLGRPTNMSVLRAPYTGALHAVNLDGVRVLVLKGCQATVWNSASNTFEGTGANVPPPERCDMTRSTVVQDPLGGAYLVGGLRMGMPSARVDRVRNDGTWVQGVAMVAPRVEPAAVILRERELLVLGGQADATLPAMERYSLDGSVPMDRRAQRTGDADLDARTGAALVRVGDMAYALGGVRVGTTDLAASDAVLDLACLDEMCPLLLRTAPLLTTRRRDAQAAVAEGNQVLVVGGTNASGAVEPADRVDGAMPRAPVAGGVAGMLGAQGLTLARAHNGSVVIAGGGQRGVWFFRR